MLMFFINLLAKRYTACPSCQSMLKQWILANPTASAKSIADARDKVHERCKSCTLEYLEWHVQCKLEEIKQLRIELGLEVENAN